MFARSKKDAHNKSLMFFRSLLLTAVANLMFCTYLFAYFAGFGIFCKDLDALDGFVMLWEALALEGFGKLLKCLGRFWEAVASA